MHITLTLILEDDELHWIDKVQQAYSLVSLEPLMANIGRNPFRRTNGNYFDMDDVFAAHELFSDAHSRQAAIYKSTDSDFGRAIVAQYQKAIDIYDEFYNWCLEATE